MGIIISAQKCKNRGRNKLDEWWGTKEIHKEIELNDQRGITVSLLVIKKKIEKNASLNGLIKFITPILSFYIFLAEILLFD